MQAVSTTPTAAPAPSLLDQQIKDVDSNISTGKARMKKLSDTKPDGYEDELAYLREKDIELCEEKRQLRKEKLLLLRTLNT